MAWPIFILCRAGPHLRRHEPDRAWPGMTRWPDIAAGSSVPKTENPPPAPPVPECATNTNNFFYDGSGHGRGHSGNWGRGSRNGGGGSGARYGNNNNPNAPHWSPSSPRRPVCGAGWHAPWTGATGPVLLGSRPLMPAQAYQAFQPSTMTTPLHALSWDTSDLLHALQAASIQQTTTPGEWYMDSGASSHMTGDQGNMMIPLK
jgi:hypothetical protein